jgi:hypothetical protein
MPLGNREGDFQTSDPQVRRPAEQMGVIASQINRSHGG